MRQLLLGDTAYHVSVLDVLFIILVKYFQKRVSNYKLTTKKSFDWFFLLLLQMLLIELKQFTGVFFSSYQNETERNKENIFCYKIYMK